MIPQASNYPVDFDSDENLFLVHDALRLRLAEDYQPGDTSIVVEGSPEVMARFPASGLITLTEQCSDIEDRALSFHYSGKTDTGFTGLELLPGFDDVVKPRRATNVTQNVMAAHHNNLKDALIAIEKFVGTKGSIDTRPFGDTMEGRVNYLRRLVFTPRAWFTADNNIGLAPLTVEFREQCFRLGPGPVTFVWEFGDATTSNVSVIHVASNVPVEQVDVKVKDLDGSTIVKTYTNPGNYSVKLKVYNEFGEDTVMFENMISVRHPAPEEAQINFVPRSGQIATEGDATPTFDRLGGEPGGPFDSPPTIRTAANTFVDIEVPVGERAPGLSYAGESLNNSGNPVDPIVSYTWSLADDLTHGNTRQTRASYSIGGIYDVKVRTDTEFGSFRITSYERSIDVIERRNMWLFLVDEADNAKAQEYGLLSETFKRATRTLALVRDDSFLDGLGEFDVTSGTYPVSEQAKKEFDRNTGFAQVTSSASGEHGSALLLYAGGGTDVTPLNSQPVRTAEYEGFSDVYTSTGLSITRPWNWVFFNAPSKGYLLFGPATPEVPNTNLASQSKTAIAYSPSYFATTTTIQPGNYLNGANELQEHVTSGYDGSGEPENGRFAVYRSTWRGQTGFLLRNSGAGTFFRLSSFYKTEGTITDPFINLKKLPDMPGPIRTEGRLVGMTDGVFFFNNSGTITAYNDVTGVWQTGGPSASSPTFRSVQDSSALNFDDQSNTLLATSDGDRVAYLSFDYSPNAFVKFNATDLTFTNQGSRPTGKQWLMDVY
jgi:PKD repeat protein